MTDERRKAVMEAFEASVNEAKERKALRGSREEIEQKIEHHRGEAKRLERELSEMEHPAYASSPALDNLIALIKKEAGYE